jgi:hypothetical protein
MRFSRSCVLSHNDAVDHDSGGWIVKKASNHQQDNDRFIVVTRFFSKSHHQTLTSSARQGIRFTRGCHFIALKSLTKRRLYSWYECKAYSIREKQV